MRNAMRRISCGLGTICVSLMLAAPAAAVPIQYAGNGHWYDFVSGNFTWAQALAAAGSSTFFDGANLLQGYLVNITSAGENAFLNANYSSGYWLGGTDQVTEGTWVWVTGPENGLVFWNNGPVASVYSNWNGGEPNNLGDEDWVTENLFGVNWNDWCSTCTTNYVVEYSGRDQQPVIPEPATLLLVSTGIGLAARARRRRA